MGTMPTTPGFPLHRYLVSHLFIIYVAAVTIADFLGSWIVEGLQRIWKLLLS